MPTWPLQSECDKFYGNPRGARGNYSPKWAAANLTHVPCPWPLYVGNGKTAPFVAIHKKCADSLARVLAAIWTAAGKDFKKIHALKYDVYDGSFNYRPKRGSSSLSMHAYGCAIDWDAADNPFRSQKHLFTPNSSIVKEFEKEGWVWGGRWSSPDAMHVQAARIR